MTLFPQAPLNAEVTDGSTITVTGEEELWNGTKICFDWDNPEYKTYSCNVVSGKLSDCAATESLSC